MNPTGQPSKRDDLISRLVEANPRARLDKITIYVDSFIDYHEASKNITEHGNVVAHPRTGQPIDNPYCKIKAKAIAVLTKVGRQLKTDILWPTDPPANPELFRAK